MTYKTRQEVLRAAADWMDVCEKAGVEARCKWTGLIKNVEFCAFDNPPEQYEFPLALLEGREVWVGSELWCCISNHKFTVKELCNNGNAFRYATVYDGRVCVAKDSASWNPPNPATVMVEIPFDTAEWYAANKYAEAYQPYFVSEACKKALESLK